MNAEQRGFSLGSPLPSEKSRPRASALVRVLFLLPDKIHPRASALVRVLFLLLLLLAAGLRFYRLDAQSFWNDEGNAVRAAERPIPLVIAAARGDIHPPGYYLLLHFWRIPTGDSEFAVRALSVHIGLLAVALTGRLGRRMFGAEVGLTAALLAATSPLAVYYSQEARMYGLLGLVAVAATDLLWSFLRRPGLRTGLPYALVAAVGLYVHYSFPFVLVAHNLLVLGWWMKRPAGRRLGEALRWLAFQGLVLLLYLPWLPNALRATGWPSAGRNYTLAGALLDILRALTVGITLEADAARPVLYGAGALLLLGFWPRRKTTPAVATLALWLLVPLVLIFAFDLYKPAYLKFLLAVLPPFHILLAVGIRNLARPFRFSRLASPTPSALTLYAFTLYAFTLYAFTFHAFTSHALLPSLRNLYFNPAYARDDYRQIAADIEALGRPGDGILLNAPNQWEVFTYYYKGDLPIYPFIYHPRPEEVGPWLEPILAAHRRLFVLYWGDLEADPQRWLENLLADQAYPAWSRWYGRVRVALYGLGPLPEEPRAATRARFGPEILLHGYVVGEGPFAPGDVVPVTLFWEADAPPGRYKVFLHLLDDGGNLVAQNDAEPRGDLSPTFIWSVGETVTDRHGVYLPPDLPPGRYRLRAGMYRLDTGERLPLSLDGAPAGDALELGEVVVR
ncbi:MAG: glycosyltransferase family 39 protein [Thermoflexales bacterium]|nr:glycosyltransferase family 39 protein [Thermoflexales bacterium]